EVDQCQLWPRIDAVAAQPENHVVVRPLGATAGDHLDPIVGEREEQVSPEEPGGPEHQSPRAHSVTPAVRNRSSSTSTSTRRALRRADTSRRARLTINAPS